MGNLSIFDYYDRPHNIAFHDLTTRLKPRPNIRSLLGLGLKFIPTPFRTTTFNHLLKEDSGLPHLERSLQLRCFFLAVGYPPTDVEFNPRLHVPSDWEIPDGFFPKPLKKRLFNFRVRLRQLFKQRRTIPNLSLPQRNALEYLRTQQEFLVVNCDKNLGPALIERDEYIKLAIKDHLSDESTYQRLSPEETTRHITLNRTRLNNWLKDHEEELNKQEFHYIDYHSSRVQDPLPYFYLLMKVHKGPPLQSRPIVSFSGSLYHSLGVWIDTQLQAVAKSFTSYLDSSFELVDILKKLKLPANCRLFTADAKSMYTNIDTSTAINAIHDYIINNYNKFPTIPITPLVEALDMLMNNNIFVFGDTFWKQKNGTAMGAPPAPTYANASFATFEDTFLPDFLTFLLLYKRYINDIFGIWICDPDPVVDAMKFKEFESRLNGWTGLTWKLSPLSTTVEFLDLTLTIVGDQITTTIFEKPLNKHLYLPARSAHPPGVLLGLIAGHIHRAFALSTDPTDARASVRELYGHLRARGYSNSTLRPLFLRSLASRSDPSATSVSRQRSLPTEPNHWLFKMNYHPQDPDSSQIRKAWTWTVDKPPFCPKTLNRLDIRYKPIGQRKFIVCYHRGKNLGNILSYRKLRQESGPNVSSFLD